MQFLKAAVNAKRTFEGKEELDAAQLLKHFREKASQINVPYEMLKRNVNEGFSGGEKKRFEIFQMAVLGSVLGILDETDSGLDIDALRVVSDGVNSMRSPEHGFLLITHYQRLLDYIVPRPRPHPHQRPDHQVRQQRTRRRTRKNRLRPLRRQRGRRRPRVNTNPP